MTIRSALLQIHLWVGLVLCLPLVLLGLTGSVLVFGGDIERALQRRPGLQASAGAIRPLDEIAAAALAGSAKGARVTNLALPERDGAPARVRVGRGARGGEIVAVDPVNLRVLARDAAGPGGGGFLGAVHRLHANLLLQGSQGRNLVGALGLAMCVLGVSGLTLWWPRPGRWRAAFSVRPNARGFTLHRDLHGATGIWMLLVFLTVSFSGVYLAFPQPAAAVIGAILPGGDLRTSASALRVTPIKGAPRLSFDAAAALARRAVPDGRLLAIAPSPKPDQPMRIGLAPPGWREGAPFITIYADPYTGRIVEIRDPRRYTPGETLQAWQHALHAGEGLGLLWKMLVFLAGLTPLVFAVTGASMWLIKRRARAGADAEAERTEA